MNLKYLIGAIISIPSLPIMYFQGKRIKKKIPQLPEAKGNEGHAACKEGSDARLNIISLGESTIAGVGVETHEEGFTGTLAKELSNLLQANISWKVYAKSGYNARKVRQLLLPQIKEDKIDLIVIGLGGNDAFELNRPSAWRTQVISLLEAIHRRFPETPIVFCNMPPIKLFPAFTPLIKFTIGNLVEILGQELESTADRFENTFYFGEKITFEEWSKRYDVETSEQNFFSDGVHPSKLTYQVWAKDVASNIFNNKEFTALLKN